MTAGAAKTVNRIQIIPNSEAHCNAGPTAG